MEKEIKGRDNRIKIVGYYKCKKCGFKFESEYVYPDREQAGLHKPREYRFCEKCGKKPKGSENLEWTAKLTKL